MVVTRMDPGWGGDGSLEGLQIAVGGVLQRRSPSLPCKLEFLIRRCTFVSSLILVGLTVHWKDLREITAN